MRFSFALGSATLLALAAGCHPASPPQDKAAPAPVAVETPSRKPGLWKQTIFIEEANVVQAMTLCLDKATDAKFAWWGQSGVRKSCTKNDVVRQADGSWKFSSVCSMGGGAQTTTNGTAIGDFDSKYQLKAEATTTNSPVPELSGTRTITIDAEWQGECPAGMRPGDVELPDGQRANLEELAPSEDAAP